MDEERNVCDRDVYSRFANRDLRKALVYGFYLFGGAQLHETHIKFGEELREGKVFPLENRLQTFLENIEREGISAAKLWDYSSKSMDTAKMFNANGNLGMFLFQGKQGYFSRNEAKVEIACVVGYDLSSQKKVDDTVKILETFQDTYRTITLPDWKKVNKSYQL